MPEIIFDVVFGEDYLINFIANFIFSSNNLIFYVGIVTVCNQMTPKSYPPVRCGPTLNMKETRILPTRLSAIKRVK